MNTGAIKYCLWHNTFLLAAALTSFITALSLVLTAAILVLGPFLLS